MADIPTPDTLSADSPIPTYIPSDGRAGVITTHEYIGEHGDIFDWTVVVHTDEDAEEYHEQSGIPHDRLEVSGATSMSEQRNYIHNECGIEDGQWYLSMDDNVRGMTAVPHPKYDEPMLPVKDQPESDGTDYRELYDTQIGPERFRDICLETAAQSEELNAYHAGFATTGNYFFRGKKWRYVGYIIGKTTLTKKSHIEYDERYDAMTDRQFTAENLLQYGRVCVNNFVYPDAAHYEEGGIGTYDEREQAKIEGCAMLMNEYPGLYRYADKADRHPKSEVRLRYHSMDQIDNWRWEMVEEHDNITV